MRKVINLMMTFHYNYKLLSQQLFSIMKVNFMKMIFFHQNYEISSNDESSSQRLVFHYNHEFSSLP